MENCIENIDKELSAARQKCPGAMARMRRRGGQAAIEYVLVVMISASIFGFLFWAVRITIYDVWVCYMGPRIQSPGGCGSTENCWNAIRAVSGNVPAFTAAIDFQKESCTDVYSKF